MRSGGCLALLCLAVTAVLAGAETHFDSEAIRLNNRGVAHMGQQFTERAANSFSDAFKKDPKLTQAAINEGIALMTLQKLDEAKKSLNAAIALDPLLLEDDAVGGRLADDGIEPDGSLLPILGPSVDGVAGRDLPSTTAA